MPLFTSKRRAKPQQHERGEGNRIPVSLQAVFVASNRGAEVVKPPPQKNAFKMFPSMPKPILTMFYGEKDRKKNSSNNKKTIPPNRTSARLSQPITVKVVRDDNIPKSIALNGSSLHKKAPIPKLTPQKYLESLLRSRGYSTELYNVLSCAYYNTPTLLQEASYGVYTVDVVRRNDDVTLEALFELGLHPNACNSFGESLVHLACRRGNFQSLQVMVDWNCSVQVADDYGRTPFHDLCWTAEPCFQSAAILLEIDPRLLLMKDIRGSTPLAYARKEHWAAWIRFLESHKDEYWPRRYNNPQGPPPLAEKPANSKPLKDPKNALSVRLATLVASGQLSIEEADVIRDDTRNGNLEDICNSSLDDDSDETTSSDDNDDDDDLELSVTSEFDGDELDEVLRSLHALKATRRTR
jgi:Ankyrin repeats (many copies)